MVRAEDIAFGRYPRNMRSGKSAGAILALALHAALIAILWQATLSHVPIEARRETTLWLTLPARPRVEEQKTPAVERPSRAQPAIPRKFPLYSGPNAIAPPAAPEGKALEGLHGSLFGCAPENLPNLSEAQRTRCRQGGTAMAPYDPNAVDYADHSGKVPGAPRWAREVARKNAPLLLPCANPGGISPIYTAMCVAQGVVNGFDLEHKPEYFDKPQEAHVPNNGDPQPLH